MEAKDLAVALARARIGLGAAALVAPGWSARALSGRAASRGATKLFARMLGARDVALGLGVVIALDRGAPVRGWLEACTLADGADLGACLIERDHVSHASLPVAVGLAAIGSLSSAWLARQLDPPPPADPGHPEAVATGHPPERVAAGATAA